MKAGGGIFMRIALLGMAFLPAACDGNHGIEIGNPDLKGKTILIEPESSTTFYILQILDEKTVVSQVKTETFETVAVTFIRQGYRLTVEAGFSDGTHAQFQSTFDEEGQFSEVRIKLNGLSVPASFDVEEKEVAMIPSGEAVTALADSLCARVVSCNTTFVQEACESQVLQAPGLSKDFGDLAVQSLNEASQQIADGQLFVDEQALNECVAAVGIVPCATVQKDFNDGEPADYGRIEKIVPKPVCLHVIQQ